MSFYIRVERVDARAVKVTRDGEKDRYEVG